MREISGAYRRASDDDCCCDERDEDGEFHVDFVDVICLEDGQ
jgi:hypothetical protein